MTTQVLEQTQLGDVSNTGSMAIEGTLPYRVQVEITGAAPILFHRWQTEAVEAKARAAKNSVAKKTDNLESYVYRLENGNLGIPGSYLIGTLTDPRRGAAKFRQDPRSPRKSALDLYRAAVLPITDLADLGVKDWDYEDRRRAVVQNNGITRVRPALHSGWSALFYLLVTMPEYVSPADLNESLSLAGRAVGIGDYRPTFGRFNVTRFGVVED